MGKKLAVLQYDKRKIPTKLGYFLMRFEYFFKFLTNVSKSLTNGSSG